MSELKEVKLFVMDVDGTMTDGKIYVGADGELMKAFDVKDGYALARCHMYGIKTAIITGRYSRIVEKRAEVLAIDEIFQGVKDKVVVLESLVKKYSCDWSEVVYIGDDENDIECMKKCGYSACPYDAVKSVIETADYVCTHKGGNGAVREILDKVFEKNDNKQQQ